MSRRTQLRAIARQEDLVEQLVDRMCNCPIEDEKNIRMVMFAEKDKLAEMKRVFEAMEFLRNI